VRLRILFIATILRFNERMALGDRRTDRQT
jgi:hypothetical protein